LSRQPVPWRTLSKLAVFVAVSVLALVVVTSSLLNLRSEPQSSYSALFSNASGLQPGDFVDIAGVQVGTVTGVRLQGRQALVNFTADTRQSLTTTTLAHIDYANLLGQQLLALEPGHGAGAPLRPGSQIPVTRTAPALNLSSIFNGFQPLFAALTPSQVNELTGSIIEIFQGESGTISNLVTQTASLTENLAQRQELIGQVIDNLSAVAGNLDAHNQQLVNLIDQFDGLVNGLANEKGQLGTTLDSLGGLTQAVSGLLEQSQPSLDEVINGVVSASHTAAQDQSGLDGVLANLPAFIETLDKISASGDFLNVYICNLEINVHGTVDVNVLTGQPSVPITLPSGSVGTSSAHTANCS
jgi:phospholipid/cholesterol/gamma-HCH transport system substrate-binding protein